MKTVIFENNIIKEIVTHTDIPYSRHQKEEVLGYQIIQVYQKLLSNEEENIIDFWKQELAVTNDIEAKRRCNEVLYIACDAFWNIIGVSTVGNYRINNQGEYYYYRMFIRPVNRGSYLSTHMLLKTRDYLLLHKQTDNKEGFILVTQNKKMMQTGCKQWFKRHQFKHIGLDPQGYDIWLSKYKEIL